MIYVFGDYELDTRLYELRHAGKPTRLEPKVFDVLAYLLQHRDRVVIRQELLEQLWPRQFIGEAVLSYCIMTARKAVGDSGRTQRIIKTLHGRGFRFVASVQEAAAPRQSVSSAATSCLAADHCPPRPGEQLVPEDQTESMRAGDAVSAPETCLRFEVEGARGVTPFVGRARELQMLSDRFTQVKAGRGQAVFVMGEPGIGKSRLLFEFHRQLGDVDAAWLEGHGLSFGQTIAFHPLISLLKQHCHIQEHDAESTVREKLTQAVLSLSQELHSLLPYLCYLLAIEPGDPAVRTMDPQLRRREIFDALRRFLVQAASVRMARAVLATTSLPKELEALLVQRAEGNPFFVEEILKSLRDVGILQRAGHHYVLARPLDEIAVPDTIQDVLMARIDRLQSAPKRILQIASVIGREFTRRLLDRIDGHWDRSETCLQTLKGGELIYEKSLYPEVVYVFKHSLTHEVAYRSLPLHRQRALHRRIGRAVEELYAERLAEQYEVLAYHFMKGEEWTKALVYLCRAAEKAAQAFATREAVTLYDQALEAAHKLGKAVDAHTLMQIYQGQANLHLALNDFEHALAAGERWLTLARRTEDRASEGAALESMAVASRYAHDLDRALAYARQAIAAAGQVGATPVISGSYLVTGSVHYLTGRLHQARADIDTALRMSRAMGDVTRQSLALYAAGLLRNWEGNFSEASRLQAECLMLARTHSLVPSLVRCYFGYGVTLTGQGEYDAALAVFEEGLALTERVGDELYHCRLLNSLGWLYFELGNLDHALDLNRRSAEGARHRGNPETIANAELNLGDLFLAKGDLPLAREFLDSVHRLVQDPTTGERMKWRYSTHLFASWGEFWLARGSLGEARQYADRCLEIATRTNSRKYLVKAWRLRGEIALVRGQWEDAERALRQALILAQALGNPTQCWRTYLAIGRLYRESKRAEASRRAYGAARQVIAGITANLQDPGLRASLTRAPLSQEVYHPNFARNLGTK